MKLLKNLLRKKMMIFREIVFSVFSSDRTTLFLNFLKMMKRKGSHFPFTIFITDRSLPGTHWWSIPNIYFKNLLLLFDSYGFIGFKAFIEQDDSDIINRIFYETESRNLVQQPPIYLT